MSSFRQSSPCRPGPNVKCSESVPSSLPPSRVNLLLVLNVMRCTLVHFSYNGPLTHLYLFLTPHVLRRVQTKDVLPTLSTLSLLPDAVPSPLLPLFLVLNVVLVRLGVTRDSVPGSCKKRPVPWIDSLSNNLIYHGKRTCVQQEGQTETLLESFNVRRTRPLRVSQVLLVPEGRRRAWVDVLRRRL